MELLTINDTYPDDFLKIFAKYNIKYPKEGEIVSLERVEKLPRIGKTGFYVSPYTNQFIDGKIFGVEGSKEVSFDSKRFTTLLGQSLTEEMIKEFKEEKKGNLEIIKIDKKDGTERFN